ncbi:PQQ-binding-like beta-propeller repeat protein [Tsukamurella pseudospumae]|uniref:Pyrrolo-quinoline quinone repeat domain-containing protein n=1 Tax=Tsukamurella pseudospumae TaxID=239498 RepID=A0A138AIB9_9ACTN|nr:PQQ-binding-like beta-propeller repeat protein [Tsukamurella pseudospumae]KXP10223.1 hypothetical protein AXK60_07060 [Tsukamurella pseudospumae]
MNPHQPQPGQPRSRRPAAPVDPASEGHRFTARTLLFIAVPLVVLLVAAVGIAIYAMNRDRSPRPLAEAETRGAFPRGPEVGWTVAASEVAPAMFNDPVFGVRMTYQRRSVVIDLGELAVVGIAAGSQSGSTEQHPVLVALETATGRVAWQTPADVQKCASKAVHGLLPCAVTPGASGEARGVSLIRVADGSVERVLPAEGSVRNVEVVGESIVTVQGVTGGGGLGTTIVTRGSVESLSAEWETSPSPTARCWGTGDVLYFGADEDFIHFGNDAGQVLVDARTGATAYPEELTMLDVRPGQGVAGQTCESDSAVSPRTVQFLDGRGKPLHTLRADSDAPLDTAGSLSRDAPYLNGSDLYDFASGTRLWGLDPATYPADQRRDAYLVGGTLIIERSCGTSCSELAGFDPATGERWWSGTRASLGGYGTKTGRTWLTDSTRVITAGTRGLTAIDVRDGSTAWTMSTGIAGGTLYRVGGGFLLHGNTTITYYPPTA